jgi:hypothetical protein
MSARGSDHGADSELIGSFRRSVFCTGSFIMITSFLKKIEKEKIGILKGHRDNGQHLHSSLR